MIAIRLLFSVAIALCGVAILGEMALSLRQGGFAIVPGLVLGGAMVTFGIYRASLIMRVLRARGN